MTIDRHAWQERLDSSVRHRLVPGASLAVWAGGQTTELASGVLNRGTGVETTVDSLFQIGSITKVWTATQVMQFMDQGRLELDTPVAEVLPGFRVADPDVSKLVTVRHLLTHTSGMDGDFFPDCGRGDDCLERFVTDCAGLAQVLPMGATLSYCNSGYSIAGRIIEVLGGCVWDDALYRGLVEPLGLTHTCTLPEEVLRYRSAWGHVGAPGLRPEPASEWAPVRLAGPAGLISTRASDLIAFARMHLEGGRTPGGERVLDPELVAEMQRPQVATPVPGWAMAPTEVGLDHWGIGWMLMCWDGRRVYGHDGVTIGQKAFLRIAPDSDVAVVLLTNGGGAEDLYLDIVGGLFDQLCGITVPRFDPGDGAGTDGVGTDGAENAGLYEVGELTVEITGGSGRLTARIATRGLLAATGAFPEELDLVPVTTDQWAARQGPGAPWLPLCFFRLPDGTPCLHVGARAVPRVA
jgi:CubicO group peptidase (beta-lactamase class C family)